MPPAMELMLNERRHFVKYDAKDLEAPNSSMERKREYIVVVRIFMKPWMMNMFYRKLSSSVLGCMFFIEPWWLIRSLR